MDIRREQLGFLPLWVGSLRSSGRVTPGSPQSKNIRVPCKRKAQLSVSLPATKEVCEEALGT